MASNGQTITVDEALVSMGFGKFQFLVLAYAGLGWIAEAMEMMLLSFVGPAVQSEWNLSSHEESLITSIVFAGMLVGAYTWGIISDNYGRRQLITQDPWKIRVGKRSTNCRKQDRTSLPLNQKSAGYIVKKTNIKAWKGFLCTAIITSVAGFLSALAPNYITLIILRCFVGIGLGGGPVLASWFLEFIPAPDRGTWMVIFLAFWTVGTILEASLAWLIMPTLGWRWLLALSSLPTFGLLLFYHVTPESPRYLCLKGRTAEALIILEKVARLNQVELPSGILASEHTMEVNETSNPTEDTRLLCLSPTRNEAEIAKTIDSKTDSTSSPLMLLSRNLIRSTLLLWVVFFGNAFSYYGLVLLTSELTISSSRCMSTSLQSDYSQNANPYRDVLITSFAEFPGILLSAATVDRIGRKRSMSAMFFLCCIFLLPLVFHQSESLTTAILFGARICITGTFTIVYIYAPEVYPTSVRTTGVGVASSIGRIGGMICPLVAVGLVQGCHQTAALVLFEIVIFLSGVAVLFFPFETKGCELSDSITKLKQIEE